MNSKSDKFKLSPKEYLFLAVCLFIYFLGGFYFSSGGQMPKDINSIYLMIGGIVVIIPIIIYILKNYW